MLVEVLGRKLYKRQVFPYSSANGWCMTELRYIIFFCTVTSMMSEKIKLS